MSGPVWAKVIDWILIRVAGLTSSRGLGHCARPKAVWRVDAPFCFPASHPWSSTAGPRGSRSCLLVSRRCLFRSRGCQSGFPAFSQCRHLAPPALVLKAILEVIRLNCHFVRKSLTISWDCSLCLLIARDFRCKRECRQIAAGHSSSLINWGRSRFSSWRRRCGFPSPS